MRGISGVNGRSQDMNRTLVIIGVIDVLAVLILKPLSALPFFRR
jgi:hypothetical protein